MRSFRLKLTTCCLLVASFRGGAQAKIFRTFYEGVDYRAQVQAGYPWSANFDAYLGYGYIAWGHKVMPTKKLKDVLYGYVRPNLRFQTSGVVNRLEARFDLYPISFFGVTVGQVFSYSALNVLGDTSQRTGVDCTTVDCNGLLFRSFLEAKLKAGYGDYFGLLFARWDFLINGGRKSRGFYDSSKSLVGSGRSDTLETQWLKFGKKLEDPRWAVGLHLEHDHMRGTQQHAYQEQIFVSYRAPDPWTLGGGLKFFQTPQDKFILGVGFQLNWDGKTSVEL